MRYTRRPKSAMNKRVDGQQFEGTHDSYLEIRRWLTNNSRIDCVCTWFPEDGIMSVVDTNKPHSPRSLLLIRGDWIVQDTGNGETFIVKRIGT